MEPLFPRKGEDEKLARLLTLLASRQASRRQQSWYCRPLSDLSSKTKCPAEASEQERRGSYMRLPNSFPMIASSGRAAGLLGELNDTWLSVATGSEDFSYKKLRKNIFEEMLFKCEDDRFEHDVTLNACDHVIATLEAALREEAKDGETPGRYQRLSKVDSTPRTSGCT